MGVRTYPGYVNANRNEVLQLYPTHHFTTDIHTYFNMIYTPFYYGYCGGVRGPLQNHMIRTTVVPLRRIAIFGQLCSQLVS
jgi:hypothetical protein